MLIEKKIQNPEPKPFEEFKEWAKQEDPESAARAEAAQSETVTLLRKEGAPSPEASTVDPNKLLRDKANLGNKIIELADGGDVLPNSVTSAAFITPTHDRLTASRTKSGTVLSVGLEKYVDGALEITELHSGSLADANGGLGEYLTILSPNHGGKSSGIRVQIGTSDVNLGQVRGQQWSPDGDSGGFKRPYLTRENSDEALNAAMADLSGAVQAAEQHAAKA